MRLLIQMFLDTQEKRCFIETLVEEYSSFMLATAMRYVKNKYVAEDILQDCVVKLILHINVVMTLPHRVLPAYIAITVRNTSFNYLRAKATRERHFPKIPVGELDEFAAENQTIEQMLIFADEKRHFNEAWSRLREADRTLLVKKYLLDKTDTEIASELGCKKDSVRMKLTRARRRAAKLYSEEGKP